MVGKTPLLTNRKVDTTRYASAIQLVMVGPNHKTTKRGKISRIQTEAASARVCRHRISATGSIPPLVRRTAPLHTLARGPIFGAHYIQERLTVRQLDEVRFGRKVRSSVRTCATAFRK